ncbi:MAG TPA: HAMP domain-containing sensor histidine kinase [Bacteroidota bacterium]|nr:HAMP domain-containing sensor histidine kinase [Bacteroidota bacterium]
MFANLSLSAKLLLTFVPLFIVAVIGSYALNSSTQEEQMLEQARSAAFQKAHIVRESLVFQMLENERVDDTYLEKIRTAGGLKDLYIRIEPERLRLRDWLEDNTREERLRIRAIKASERGEFGNEVFATGKAYYRFLDEDNFEAVIPFRAEKKCQACHDVKVNEVLGVAHIQLPLTELRAAISANAQKTAMISLGFGLVVLAVGFVLYRSLIQKPVQTLVSATEAIGKGDLNYSMTVLRSNDELGQLSRSFENMRKALKQSQEALRTSMVGQIASSLIRDFRAPMREILTSVDAMKKGGQSAEQTKQLCDTAQNAVQVMNKMTQDLMDFTTGELRINKMASNVPGIVNYVATAVKQDLDRDMIRLEINQGFRGNVPLDYERFSRALINIISYSANYVPPGGVIRLSTESQSGSLIVKVSDNGNGIPANFLEKIFDPFVKIVQEKGVGLALALAKRIIEMQGGKILVESVEGKGTTFTITMPMS